MAAARRRYRRAISMAATAWIAAPIMWRKMKSILSHRRRRDAAKQAKSRGLRSRRRMQRSLLPSHIVDGILSWLPVKSLVRFRCVCKEWRSLTCDPNFIKEHHACARALGRLALISTRNSSPKILLYDFGDKGEVRNQGFNMGLGDLSGYNTLSNPVNGLVCIKCCNRGGYGEGRYYLLNPATRELAKLPTSRNGTWGKHSSSRLRLDSSTGGYKLVELFYNDGFLDRCGCKVLELGSQGWREVGGAPCMMPISEPVVLNGAIHWLSWRSPTGNIDSVELSIERLNLKDEKFQSIPVPPECQTQMGHDNLVEWEGLLCIVKVHSMYGPSLVRIWRLEENATGRWREAHCSELRNYTRRDGKLVVVGIRGHEMLIMLHRGVVVGAGVLVSMAFPGAGGSIGSNVPGAGGSICSYDLRTRSLRKLYNYDGEDPSGLQFLTESLVSPRYLAGDR